MRKFFSGLNLWTLLCVVAPTLLGASPETIKLYLLAGQSNAEGHNHTNQYRGGLEPFPARLSPQSNILFWPGPNHPGASNLWTSLRVEPSGAFGPEISFGAEMQRLMPAAKIAIVKFASGGTGIARSEDYSDYIPSLKNFKDNGRNWHPPTDGRPAGNLYQSLFENFRTATDILNREGKKWELCGFLWMQGEHEAGISKRMAEDYQKILTDFIRSVRADLRQPQLPWVIGEINSHTWAFGDIARARQAAACREDKRIRLVTTVDLPRVQGDGSHFTADSMLTLGARFATAMFDLEQYR